MALVVADRVKETTTTTGTGTVTLAGASTGYQSFAAVGDGNSTYYCIAGQGTDEWEVGVGTYTASGTTLSRTTILASSNSGSAVNFSAGSKDVFVTFPAERSSALSTVTTTEITATAGQTTFTPNGGYEPDYLEVYLNGLLLTSADYTATDGINVVLASAASSGDEFMSIAWGNFSIVNVFPTQSGNAGKYLTTDGTNVSWAAVNADPAGTAVAMAIALG